MKITLFRISGLIFTVAAFIVGIVGGTGERTKLSWEYFISLFSSERQADRIVAIGLVLAIFATFVFILSSISFVFKRSVKHISIRLHDGNCFARACTEVDIPMIVKCADGYFASATDQAQTLRLHRVDPTIFTIYETAERKFLGYSGILRLTRHGVNAINRGDFSINNIPYEYVRHDQKYEGCPVYIGAVCCTSIFMRGFVLGRVYGNIERMRAPAIYARAATRDGLRILKRRKFEAVDNNKDGVGGLFKLIP